jgi:dienelactone hydrolase
MDRTTVENLTNDPLVQGDRERFRHETLLDTRGRYLAENRLDEAEYQRLRSRADWERFRDVRLAALRRSLGRWPTAPRHLDVEVTRTIPGEGFRIECLVFASRPGLVVTANLYAPDPPQERMPGILICHSHHNPKSHGELQDMGMTWARLGCLVLIPDMLGHGERRQQPFAGREDYHSRYTIGVQLNLVGESLMGWMVWDLMRSLDALLSRPGIDRERIIALGSVAGGGDPTAVLVAFDPRVTCSIPFNFGAAETLRPDPRQPDGPREPNMAGNGGWESTRNLRLNARDGFLPWMIVAAAAPRFLVSAHEFQWSPDKDPVYGRLERIYGFYGAKDRLDSVHGWGGVHLRPPEGSHCNHVGPPHRAGLYPILKRWLEMPIPEPEYQKRLAPEELSALTPETVARFRPRMLHALAAEMAAERLAAARAARARFAPAERRRTLRNQLSDLLGDVEPAQKSIVAECREQSADGAMVERVVLTVDEGVSVPLTLLRPAKTEGRSPVVVGLAYEGKARFAGERAAEIAALLNGGAAVCLADLRGTGETGADQGNGWDVESSGASMWVSTSELMFGRTMLGLRLRDLRSVLAYLRTRPDVHAARVALWGESFSPMNPPDFVDPPLKTETPPPLAEPLGATLALLAPLFEEGVVSVAARGGLVSFAAMLATPFFQVPHDMLVPGLLEVGDVADLAAALAPLPLRFEAPVDGRNRAVSEADLADALRPAADAYADRRDRFVLSAQRRDDLVPWLFAVLGLVQRR